MEVIVDGIPYELPQEQTLTIDEAIVINDYSGLTLDQIEENNAHPGVIKALIHIAVARARPDMPRDEISKAVGTLKLSDLAAAVEADARPPDEASALASANANGADDAPGGEPSNPDGEHFPAQWSHDPSGLPV